MKILVLNAGSSSHKSCLFDLTRGVQMSQAPIPVWRGALDWTHQEGKVELSAKTDTGESCKEVLPIDNKVEGIEAMLKTLVEGPTQVFRRSGRNCVGGASRCPRRQGLPG